MLRKSVVFLPLFLLVCCSVFSFTTHSGQASALEKHAGAGVLPAVHPHTGICQSGYTCLDGVFPQDASYCTGSGGQQQELGHDNLYISNVYIGTQYLYISYYCATVWSAFRVANGQCVWGPAVSIGEYNDAEFLANPPRPPTSPSCGAWFTGLMDHSDLLYNLGSQCVSGWVFFSTGFSCCPSYYHKILRPGGVGC